MKSAAYSIALITRGTGAYAYTYLCDSKLRRGDLALVTFRDKLELGVVLGEDSAMQADQQYSPALPIEIAGQAGWGQILLGLVELFIAAPDELAGYLLFARASTGLRLRFSILEPGELPPGLVNKLGSLTGRLPPKARAALLRACDWETLRQQAALGAIRFELSITGLPGITRAHPRWRRWYRLGREVAGLQGLPPASPEIMPGHYLVGLLEAEQLDTCEVVNAPDDHVLPAAPHQSKIDLTKINWDAAWEIARLVPDLIRVPLGRAQASWADLRGNSGLAADLAQRIRAKKNTLVIAPQTWMLDRIWAELAPWAPNVMRFKSFAGPGAAAHILARLQVGRGQVVAGGPGTWKLAVYGDFDSVILIDPSHPQYQPQRYPGLDPRLALALVVARRNLALDVIELGLSVWDGATQLPQVALLKQFEPTGKLPQTEEIDTNPIPLELRQPGRKRLIYFNRLGRRRGLQCVECSTLVGCPHCGARGVYFSSVRNYYICSRCDYHTRELRCQLCGLATLSAQLPGLESVVLRPGDYVASGTTSNRSAHPEYQSVLGTSQLLEPLAEFWPEELVFVHADSRSALLDDWPAAIDQTARLAALYDNPDLEYVYIVSSRLSEQLGGALSNHQIAAQWEIEMRLRKLAGLPPYGTIHRLKLKGKTRQNVLEGRKTVGAFLKAHQSTSMLRLGRPFPGKPGMQLVGYFTNRDLAPEQLLDLRWQVHRGSARLEFSAIRGPWL